MFDFGIGSPVWSKKRSIAAKVEARKALVASSKIKSALNWGNQPAGAWRVIFGNVSNKKE